MRAHRWGAAIVAVASVIAGASIPAAAAAQDFSAGGPNWYVDAMKLGPIHDSGVTGEGVTIAVLDGGLNADIANLQGADIEVRQLEGCPDPRAATEIDAMRHGTSVTSLIVGNGTSDTGAGPIGIAPDARILYYGSLQEGCEGNMFPAVVADALAQGADIISMSGGSTRLVDELAEPTVDAAADALRAGAFVVGALPNADTIREVELGKINGVINVASVDATAQAAKQRDGSDMRNDDVDVVAPGVDVAGVGWDETWGMSAWSGNSAATPIVAGLLALAKEKWPDATSAQILQSLIRNTGPEPHELEWSDRFGHGIVNATRLIQEDPSQYEDVNPLFKDEQMPTFDEVYAETDPPSSEEPDPQADAAAPAVLPWVLGGGAVIVVAVIVIVITVSRRKSGGRQDV